MFAAAVSLSSVELPGKEKKNCLHHVAVDDRSSEGNYGGMTLGGMFAYPGEISTEIDAEKFVVADNSRFSYEKCYSAPHYPALPGTT